MRALARAGRSLCGNVCRLICWHHRPLVRITSLYDGPHLALVVLALVVHLRLETKDFRPKQAGGSLGTSTWPCKAVSGTVVETGLGPTLRACSIVPCNAWDGQYCCCNIGSEGMEIVMQAGAVATPSA